MNSPDSKESLIGCERWSLLSSLMVACFLIDVENRFWGMMTLIKVYTVVGDMVANRGEHLVSVAFISSV